jgi:hypothetical protein
MKVAMDAMNIVSSSNCLTTPDFVRFFLMKEEERGFRKGAYGIRKTKRNDDQQ